MIVDCVSQVYGRERFFGKMRMKEKYLRKHFVQFVGNFEAKMKVKDKKKNIDEVEENFKLSSNKIQSKKIVENSPQKFFNNFIAKNIISRFQFSSTIISQ